MGAPIPYTLRGKTWPGSFKSCPLCTKQLINYSGADSHLAKHVRKKEITIDQKVDILIGMYNLPDRRTKKNG